MEKYVPQTAAEPEAPAKKKVKGKWQWWHRNGWKDYSEAGNLRIETAYQRGAPSVKVKAGKYGGTPMEISFESMIQYDPVTCNTRRVRRVGTDTCRRWIMRKIGSRLLALERSQTGTKDLSRYTEARRTFLSHLDKREETRVDEFRETGCFAKVARSSFFVFFAISNIVLNALWMGYEANFNTAATIWAADPGFQVVEHTFGASFTIELIIRFCALKKRRLCFTDPWFCFDFVLVVLMVGETWVMLPIWLLSGRSVSEPAMGNLSVLRMLRLLRLTKIGRVARLLRLVPEVMTLMRGFTLALRSVAVTVVLLIVLTYVFGIIFKTQAEGHPKLAATFPKVGESMWVLLIHGTFLDAVSDKVTEIRAESWDMILLFLIFIFLSSFTLLNMLIGIICEVVTNVTNQDKNQAAVSFLKANLLEILEVHDKDGDRRIQKEEFELLLISPEMHMILTHFGVDTQDLISLKGILFEGVRVVMADLPESVGDDNDLETDPTASDSPEGALGGTGRLAIVPTPMRSLTFAELMEVVLRLRGGNGASVRDIVDLREYLKLRLDEVQRRVLKSCARTSVIEEQPFLLPTEGSSLLPSSTKGPPPELVRKLLERLAALREEMQGLREQLRRLEESTAQQKDLQMSC